MKIKEPLAFPITLAEHLQATQLAPEDQEAFHELNKTVTLQKIAKTAYAEWEAKQAHGQKETVGNIIVWRDPDETIKEAIKGDPLTAIQSYLKNPAWWTIDEIIEVACTDPQTAYWAAKKISLQPKLVWKLQIAAGRKPDLAYHFLKDIPDAKSEITKHQLSRSPYWYWRFATSQTQNPELRKEEDIKIEALAPHNPEAASFILFRNPSDTDDSDRMHIAMATLATQPEIAYKTAVKLMALPINKDMPPTRDTDWRLQELKEICLRSPKWAYHWARDFEPYFASDFLSACINHPGWATELIVLIQQTQGDTAKNDAAQKVFNRNAALYTGADIWHIAFLMWAMEFITA